MNRHEQIVADLLAAVEDGRLQPGNRLPSERDNARHYEVDVATYRMALAELRRDGWLVTCQPHGSFVALPYERRGPGNDQGPRLLSLMGQQVGQIEAEVSRLAGQLGWMGAGAVGGGPGIRDRLGRIEADLARMGKLIHALSHHAIGYDAAVQDLSWIAKALPELREAEPPHPWLSTGTPAEQNGSTPRPSPADHHPPELWVSVLGPVVVTGPRGAIGGPQADLVLALALARPGGLRISALQATLGTDPRQPKASDAVRQVITRARRQLGLAADGQMWIQNQGGGHSHLYRLHDAAVLDWALFHSLAERGIRTNSRQDLTAAMALVRGEPFAGYSRWWLGSALVDAARTLTARAAAVLASLPYEAGDTAPSGPLSARTA